MQADRILVQIIVKKKSVKFLSSFTFQQKQKRKAAADLKILGKINVFTMENVQKI